MKLAPAKSANRSHPRHRAFTRKELLVVIAVFAVLGLLIFRGFVIETRSKANRGHCISNLKNTGTSFRVFASDHDDKYPFAATNGKALNPAYHNETDAWIHFQVMSNEPGGTSVLTCPSDRERIGNSLPNSARQVISNNNAISYFVGITADEAQPTGILIGDRGVTKNRSRLQGKLLSLTTNETLRWEVPFHDAAGNMGFADGSVQQVGFRGAVPWLSLRDSVPTNRLLLPLVP